MTRHKRHIRTLKTLMAAGWMVEACYWKRDGCKGELEWHGRQVFWPFTVLHPRRAFRTPPIKTGGQEITFVVINNRPPFTGCHRIVGWRALSEFAVQERKKKQDAHRNCVEKDELKETP